MGVPVSVELVLVPDLLLEREGFHPDRAVRVDRSSGRITEVDEAEKLSAEEGVRTEQLAERALLPGFVNAHSHAFQRIIRGRTQWKPADAPEADFWSWREAMYAVARALTPEELFQIARYSFVEMLLAGFTTVGEFHYLHRDPQGRPYEDPNELARRVLAAAREAGIRIVLLNTCYARGGVGEPAGLEQARFVTQDLESFRETTDQLIEACEGEPLASVGVAPHSVRTVPREWLAPLHDLARERALPLHMHLSEQPAEVTACREAHGLGPVELVAAEGLLDPDFTGVHVTHPSAREIGLFGSARATACLCPTTERDLGDGIPPASELIAAGASLAIGTDSHTLIDPFEELRLIEYHERLRSLQRVVLAEEGSEARGALGRRLLGWGTSGGARALGLEAGEIHPGHVADLVAVDLKHRSLAGATAETLPALLAFSASAAAVTDVWVGGEWLVRDGRHRDEEAAAAAFQTVSTRLG